MSFTEILKTGSSQVVEHSVMIHHGLAKMTLLSTDDVFSVVMTDRMPTHSVVVPSNISLGLKTFWLKIEKSTLHPAPSRETEELKEAYVTAFNELLEKAGYQDCLIDGSPSIRARPLFEPFDTDKRRFVDISFSNDLTVCVGTRLGFVVDPITRAAAQEVKLRRARPTQPKRGARVLFNINHAEIEGYLTHPTYDLGQIDCENMRAYLQMELGIIYQAHGGVEINVVSVTTE